MLGLRRLGRLGTWLEGLRRRSIVDGCGGGVVVVVAPSEGELIVGDRGGGGRFGSVRGGTGPAGAFGLGGRI